MNARHYQRVPLALAGRTVEIETEWIARERTDDPLMVFLHEGLGSIAMWGDWPERLCQASGCRGLAFSRYGYGRSSPRPAGQEWPLDYLEQEAREALPALFAALEIDVANDKPILFGHSDGGTIALLHAAAFPHAVAACIAVAPHVMVEDISLTRIAHLQQTYPSGGLRDKLAAFHDDPDSVFGGWSERWRSDEFRNWDITGLLPAITCPLLAVQGAQDQYGTLEQVHAIQRRVPHARLMVIDNCRHVPHQEQPQALQAAVTGFLRTL